MPAAALIDRYREQALALLPPGRALSRRAESWIYKLLEGIAVEYARVHERAGDLLLESVPGDADELLEDWEDATGLPDCGLEPDTLEERRAALVSKLVARGGQSDAIFEAIADALSFDISLDHKYLPATCTSPCTSPVAGIEWVFTKEVTGEGTGDLELLKCRLQQHAHLYGLLLFGDIDTEAVRTTADGSTRVTGDGSTREASF